MKYSTETAKESPMMDTSKWGEWLEQAIGFGESGGFAQGGANEPVWQRRKCLEAHLIDTEANEHGEA